MWVGLKPQPSLHCFQPSQYLCSILFSFCSTLLPLSLLKVCAFQFFFFFNFIYALCFMWLVWDECLCNDQHFRCLKIQSFVLSSFLFVFRFLEVIKAQRKGFCFSSLSHMVTKWVVGERNLFLFWIFWSHQSHLRFSCSIFFVCGI